MGSAGREGKPLRMKALLMRCELLEDAVFSLFEKPRLSFRQRQLIEAASGHLHEANKAMRELGGQAPTVGETATKRRDE